MKTGGTFSMIANKREQLMRDIENHLRLITRQLLKFDTVEEILQYLIDAFQSKFNCDFVGVILKQGNELVPKVWNGGLQNLKNAFPISVAKCSPILFQQSLTYRDEIVKKQDCQFMNRLKNEDLETWFTVPIQDEHENYGFCAIGYFKYTPLFEMDKSFNEFGKDVAVSLSLAKEKEQERKKVKGIEFITKNLKLDESLDELISKIVEQARKSTGASFAGIYLYDEEKNLFFLQPPFYGQLTKPEKIITYKNYVLKDFFTYLEKPDGQEMTVPLTLDLKTLGVLHVEKKEMSGVFTKADLEILTVLTEHVATILQNVYLYQQQKEQMKRLQSLLDYEQYLIKKTIEEDGFDSITMVSGEIFGKTVLLFDRFCHLLATSDKSLQSAIEMEEVPLFNEAQTNHEYMPCTLSVNGKRKKFLFWPVIVGRDLLGFLALEDQQEELEAFDLLAIDLVRNIYSIQFIKQKLVIDTMSQVKDDFIDQLLVEQIADKESIIQYMNLFQWNLYRPHRVATLSIIFSDLEEAEADLFEKHSKKQQIFNELKGKIAQHDPQIVFAKKNDKFVLLVPVEKEQPDEYKYWQAVADQIKRWLYYRGENSVIKIGIGGITKTFNDYYKCYQQALQSLHVIDNQESTQQIAFFDDLGSYTLLHLLKDTEEANFFMNNYLEKLKKHSSTSQVDLFHTLRVYLEQNGSIKKTADELFIHRSTLLYRLEKIKEYLGMDIDDADVRFNLMLGFKLYDLRKND